MLNENEMENQFKKMKTKMYSAKNLRQFLQGIQFCIRAKGLQVNIFVPSKCFQSYKLICWG